MVDAVDDPRREAFSSLLQQRRGRLGYSQRQVYLHGGPSPATLVQLEDPERHAPPPSSKTLARLDQALQWAYGTAAKVLQGTLDPQDALTARTNAADDADPTVEQALDPARLLRDHGGELANYLFDVSNTSKIDAEQRHRGQQLTRILTDFYVTDQLEQHGGPGKSLPASLLASVLSVLNAPEPAPETQEHHRWAYRRWLAGMQCDPEDAKHFSHYWNRRS